MIPQKTMFKISHNNQKETSYAFWLDIIQAKCGVCFIICRICPQKKSPTEASYKLVHPIKYFSIPFKITILNGEMAGKSHFPMVSPWEIAIFRWENQAENKTPGLVS